MSKRSMVLLASLSVVVGLVISLTLGPSAPALADAPTSSDTGDAALAASVRSVFGAGAGRRGLAVALVEPDGTVRFAGVGDSGDAGRPQVDQRTRFEIGSVTKGLTGLLVAEQVRRGEAALDDTVGGATLEELATHTSGLPRLPRSHLVRSLPASLSGRNPYQGGAAQVLQQARDAGPSGGAKPAYSNFGAAAAGNLVAERAGKPYAALLAERVLTPLGMTSTTVLTDAPGSQLPAPRAVGTAANGAGREFWRAEGWAPAGIGVWSTTEDLARLVRALAAGTAPGQDAMEPRRSYREDDRIGLFWITSTVDGSDVTWHNGGTGGASAFVGVDRSTKRGIVVLANTDVGVDDEALELLTTGGRR
jgi:CubicO group peptidase (beta-lactamase class C family)